MSSKWQQRGTRSVHLNDRQLIHEIHMGRTELLNDIIGKYYRDVYGFCAYLTGNPDEAYDLTQETFLKFIQYVDSYRYRNLKSYLLMIARNICMDYFRGKKAVIVPPEEVPEIAVQESGYARSEIKSWLFEELQLLSAEQREAIILYYYGDLQMKEIARITGVGLSTVKSRIRQGCQKIKAGCKEDGYEG